MPGPGITIDLDVALKHAAALIDALYEVPNPSHLRLKHVFVLDPAHFSTAPALGLFGDS